MGVIDSATSGSVVINDRDVSVLSDDEQSDHRNRSVGFVFQRFNLVPVLTASENVSLPLVLRGESMKAAREKALCMLGEVGLASHANQRPDRLSGGQQQRVAIARALVTNPALVIADEPTANLDSVNAMKIVDALLGLNRAHSTTVIFATHDQRLLDHVRRLIRLEDGRVVEDVKVT
ncbi:MAG: ABC transporter ATP-binding protein, partial [bacterium]